MPLSSQSMYYEPGSTHAVVLPGDVVGKLEAVEISWEYRASVFNPLTWRLLHTPRVYVDSLTIESLEAAHGYVHDDRFADAINFDRLPLPHCHRALKSDSKRSQTQW